MARMHGGQHRSIFHFGNLFKIGRTRDSLSTKLNNIQKTFEESLAVNLMNLKPGEGSFIPSFSWMETAIMFLSDTHRNLNSLISDLEFPISNWEQQWIDIYLDDSIKLLDVCNAFSSELSRFEQCQLLLRCALHIFGENKEALSEEQLKKAHNYLSEWKQVINSESMKLEASVAILISLSESLHVANCKKSVKGKILMRALYAVKAVTIFVCSVFFAALTGSYQLPIDLHISEEYSWAQAFNSICSCVNQEIRKEFLCRRVFALNEMDAVSQSVDKLVLLMSNSDLKMQTSSQPEGLMTTNSDKEDNGAELGEAASRMVTDTKILSHGLDGLSKAVRDFFLIVMKGRDALLGSLGSSNVFGTKSVDKSRF